MRKSVKMRSFSDQMRRHGPIEPDKFISRFTTFNHGGSISMNSHSSPALAFNGSRRLIAVWGSVVLGLALFTGTAPGAAVFINGFVPDWQQPYVYNAPNGPGPDPMAGAVNQWNAWCAPTSAANLAGYWEDYHGVTVADGSVFPLTPAWSASNWHDYQADGTINRPAPRPFGTTGPPYAATTDIGWFMDTNRGVAYDTPPGMMGGDGLNNVGHTGTYLKDIHVGLGNFLNLVGGGWSTGTQGIAYAAGLASSGLPAVIHLNEGSAFAEVMGEINAERPMILSYMHWALLATGQSLAGSGTTSEQQFGGMYYTWGTPGPSNPFDEQWNFYEDGLSLGHAVTLVGFIPAGDAADRWLQCGLAGPTNWVIVHDNWQTTPRNVIVPYGFGSTWVANTNAVPEPSTLLTILCGSAVLLWSRRFRTR
jgi:hypothetical protein